jgi:hypothetical protein
MTTQPKRIRRLRQRGWRKPENAVIVDRTSRFGNPYRVGDPNIPDRETAARWFVQGLADRRAGVLTLWGGAYPSDEEIVERLRGRDLACPCPLPGPGEPDHCHAVELIRIANGGGDRG